MTPHDWVSNKITVEDRYGDPIELTTFCCRKCDSFVSVRGRVLLSLSPEEWELADNNISEDCDLENAASVMGS